MEEECKMKQLIKPEVENLYIVQSIKSSKEVRKRQLILDLQKVDGNYYNVNSLDSFSVILSPNVLTYFSYIYLYILNFFFLYKTKHIKGL